MSDDSQPLVLTETRGAVGLITLNRPKMNPLSTGLMTALGEAVHAFERDDAVGAIVITGNERAFAAGADIKEMQAKTFIDVYTEDFITANWEEVTKVRKPVIAAVSGYALGGGCELAMMCDFIVCSDTAMFGQPEINLGTMPGAGGSQRLTRLVGKSKAMDMVLTGRMMDAAEAERAGLVSRVFPAAELLDKAIAIAAEIAAKSRPAVMLCKEAVNAALDTTLTQGLKVERRLFHATFALDDQKEGMAAFVAKRPAQFTNR